MKLKSALFKLMLIFSIASVLSSCSKGEQEIAQIQTDQNEAERFVQENPDQWNGTVSVEFFDEFVKNQDVFSVQVLKECLTPGQPIDTSIEARKRKLKILEQDLQLRNRTSEQVESIVQVNSNRRIIDANPASLALVVANMGQSVPQFTSYDYLSNSLNRITTSDLFLANWALQNDNSPGNFIASDDDYIELMEGTVNLSSMLSGQNYLVEAILVYNGATTNFSFFNTLSSQNQTVSIQPGEILVYGSGTPLGELILDPTLQNETFTGEYLTDFVDARLYGPIPGGAWLTLQGGSIISPQ